MHEAEFPRPLLRGDSQASASSGCFLHVTSKQPPGACRPWHWGSVAERGPETTTTARPRPLGTCSTWADPSKPGELAVNLCYGRGVAEQWRASSASTGPARWMTAPWLQEHPPPCPPTSLSRQHQPAIPVESSQVPGSEGTEVPEALASVFGERPQSWRCARRTGSPPPQLTFQHRDGQCPSSWDAMPRLLPVCMARPPETA